MPWMYHFSRSDVKVKATETKDYRIGLLLSTHRHGAATNQMVGLFIPIPILFDLN